MRKSIKLIINEVEGTEREKKVTVQGETDDARLARKRYVRSLSDIQNGSREQEVHAVTIKSRRLRLASQTWLASFPK